MLVLLPDLFCTTPYEFEQAYRKVTFVLLPDLTDLYCCTWYKASLDKQVLLCSVCILVCTIHISTSLVIITDPVCISMLHNMLFIQFQVLVYVIIAVLTSYTKLSIIVQLHCKAQNNVTLFMAGTATQLGSFCGAILFFVLVYFTALYNA
jgi:hypothetical protein